MKVTGRALSPSAVATGQLQGWSSKIFGYVWLQVARRELSLEASIAKQNKYQLLILDDVAYVSKDQAETSVLFELINDRYERRSALITRLSTLRQMVAGFPETPR